MKKPAGVAKIVVKKTIGDEYGVYKHMKRAGSNEYLLFTYETMPDAVSAATRISRALSINDVEVRGK